MPTQTLEWLGPLFDAASVGILVIGSDGRIARANLALGAIFGYLQAELQGQPLELLLPETLHTAHEEHRAAFFAAPRARPMNKGLALSGRRKDGTVFPIEASLSPIEIAGQMMAVAFVVDVSERVRLEHEHRRLLFQEREARAVAEEAARRADESRVLLDALVQSAPTGFAFLDHELRYRLINAHLAEMNGLTAADHLGRTVAEVLPELAPNVEPLFRHVLATGEPFVNLEVRGETPLEPGVSRDWLASYYPVRHGDQIIGVGLSVLEITERRRAEEALRASERLYRALANNIPNGSVLLFDRDLRYTVAEGQALTDVGYDREHIEGRTIREVLPPARADALEPYYRATLSGRAQVIELPAGERIYMVHFVPVRDERGEIFAGMVMSWDITRLKQAEQALLEEQALLSRRVEERTADLSAANAALARANRLKDEFLANMSHELRTPLNAVLGLSEALREQTYGPLNARQDRTLAMIEDSGRHLLDLINDVLDLAKIGADKLVLEHERVIVEQICEASLRMVSQTAQAKQIELQLRLDPRVTVIMADVRRLKQILVNLLSNAVKFTAPGGRAGLEVVADDDKGTISFTVWDTGIGIAPEQLENLFQPFVQLDSRLSREYAGTGLGLALVYRMCELHGGSIAVESAPGKGSRFTAVLPWSAEGRLPLDSDQPGRPASLDLTLRSAVIIEDSPTAADQLRRYLGELGILTLALASGVNAVSAVAEARPDLVMLDILLPDTTGWEVLAQLKADPRTAAIPVVIVSVVDDESRGLALGAAAYVVKPYTRAIILNALQQLGAGPEIFGDESDRRDHAATTILVVEDNETNLVTVTDYLSAVGYVPIAARTGAEAISRASEQRPALILMDVQMPGMDGLEATRHIRANPDLADVPIIAVTALAMPGDRERCLAAGADDYLSKPISLKGLARLIEQHLRHEDDEG